MQRVLKLTVAQNPRKKKEFSQTLNSLAGVLKMSCESLTIDQSKDSDIVTILVKWESENQMYRTLRSEEFNILSGAATALCDNVVIRLNDKIIGHDLSKLYSI